MPSLPPTCMNFPLYVCCWNSDYVISFYDMHTADVINFSSVEIKEIYPLKYESHVPRQFCFFEACHINLFFCLMLGNKICLQSSSSSSRSFNISTNDKFNQKSTLRLQFIETSPHFPTFYIFHCRVLGEKTS